MGGVELMADLMDGRDLAGLKAKILSDEQEKTYDKPITAKSRIIAIVAMILSAAVLLSIYTIPFLLNQ